MKRFIIIGAISAFLAVALGAFGAHGLEHKLSEKMMDTWEKAVDYQMFHTMGLFIVAFAANKWQGSSLIKWSGIMMIIGILLFSGSLYVLSTSGITPLGMITPFGGVSFLAGWTLLALASYKSA
ncbi:DUF423 domain-containing protein [Calidifontibacillus oryziterrae]|uniref:DUF423 domain-containing protein n=1 Tax=Calidifontibacillus oryziterrae TaxID=1191699 RepID=UPI00030F1A5E|nr:DUF423 domain-containing protein [Calidifontibacillus oryziterrae]